MSNTKEQKIKEKYSKFFVIALIGVILVGVLIVLQIKFTEYMQFANPGYAIKTGTISKYLSMNPLEQDPKKNVGMYNFKAADILYEHKKSLFFDEDKKVQMDENFPVYLNHGASLQLVNGEAVLFNEQYETEKTYKGLIINEGNTYNPSGTQADASKYLFIELKNGYYVNLVPVTYKKKSSDKVIAEHSIINFTKEFFAFYELENDELVYKYCIDIKEGMPIIVNGKEYTYEEFLLLLGVTKPKVEYDDEDNSTEETTTQVEEETTSQPTTDKEEVTTEEPTTEKPSKPQKETTEQTTEEESEEETTEDVTTTTEEKTDDSNEEEEEEETTKAPQVSPGVRPDEMRPDKEPGGSNNEDKKPVVEEYVKPIVTVGDFVAGVYRISTSIEVYDPAKRIDKTKQIQFEVYEVGSKGSMTLAMRVFTGKTGPLDIGDGIIEPNKKYHVVYYFTYKNEFDERVVEQLGECDIQTKSRDTLGTIYLTHDPGVSYSNRIEIANIGYGEGTDEEAVYGINLAQGIKIKISKNGKEVSTINLNGTQIRRFKTNIRQIITSASNLTARTTYKYDFYVEDFFGNELKIENTKGEITTSRNTPYASIKLLKNEIGKVEFTFSIEDIDASAVVTNPDENGVYVVITDKSEGISSAAELGNATWYYKLSPSEYTYSEEKGLEVNNIALPSVNNLRLNKNYYISVYCDYDLSNGQGVQKFQQIGKLGFTSASLATLGKVYLDCEVTDITCNSADIKYTLNTDLTNPQLVKLLKDCKFDVLEKADDTLKTQFGFSKEDTVTDDEGNTKYVYEAFQNGESITYKVENLDSVTEYYLEAAVKAYYHAYDIDYEEDIVVSMSKVSFKTLKKPATVEVEDLLCAAGTLQLNVHVTDEDGAVTGNSGDVVVVNLYTSDGDFVKALRITKNEWHTLTYTKLDVTKDYVLRFIAVEYNEGYTNATLQSNVILKSVDVSTMLEVSGNIKLQHIDKVYNNDKEYLAYTKSQIFVSGQRDLEYINNRFYIHIEKDGVPVSDVDAYYTLDEDNLSDGLYVNIFKDLVDIGQHTYKYTLYIVAENRELVLDTLEFTTETTVESFSTAYELIKLMQNNPEGKYVAINDIYLYSGNNYKYPNETEETLKGDYVSGAKVVTTFDGTLDFQGYTLTHMYNTTGSQQFVQNFGANAKLRDVVYDVYIDRDTAIYDAGILCYRNYGTISDIIINFRGGNIAANQYFGLIGRYNASSGVIERFVVNNVPDFGSQPFSAYTYTGMLVSSNDGIIRDGYVAGEDIYLTQASASIARYCGGIVGVSNAVGHLENVFSLVNFIQAERGSSGYSYSYYYGAVAGYVSGYVHNVYSVGESNPAEYKNDTTVETTADNYGIQISPTIGQIVNGRYGDLYYWFDMSKSSSDGSTYKTKFLKMMPLDTLYNRGWQTTILGDKFDTECVETGYMPKVIMSTEMPTQTNIPLPSRVKTTDLGISTASVDKYINVNNGSDSALISVVFLNKQNYKITGIKINDVTVELDLDSAKSQDGYTTIKGTVTNPQQFKSSYKITEITYLRNNKTMREKVDFDMNMEFYRHVATANDWYEYVVLNTKNKVVENVRLTNDIDFAGIDTGRIRVTSQFDAKLDGNGMILKNIDLQKDFKTANNSTVWNLFSSAIGIDAEIYNLNIENYKGGGTYVKAGKTYVARYGSVFYDVSGVIRDVHIKGVDIVSYDRMGVFAATMNIGSELKNCSACGYDEDKNTDKDAGKYGVKLTYVQPTGSESTICAGGLVGNINYTRITNCYVTDLEISALNMKSSQGIGGIIGYSSNSVIKSVYAEGEINTRASNVGGIIGQYYASGVSVVCIKDVISKVDISSYTDVIGGIVGLLNIPADIVDTRNNTSGIASGLAIGNVYAYNPDSVYVSRTIGQVAAGKLMYFGCDTQLLNGQLGATLTDNELKCTSGIISASDLKDNANSIYLEVINLGDQFRYSQDGYIPKLNCEGKEELLPNQKDILIKDINVSGIDVTNVNINTNNRIITLRILNPNHYLITDFGIENLNVSYVKYANGGYVKCGIEDAIDYTGDVTMVLLQYDTEQEHYQDSYVLNKISYYNVKESCYDGTTVSAALNDSANIVHSEVFARVGLTMYRKINSIEQWSQIATYPDYENYTVTQDIDFASYSGYATDVKIGRLEGNGYTLKNITLKNVSLIQQVNSAITGLNFENINITASGTTNIGLIKVSNGKISNCTFKNIVINNTYKSTGTISEIGLITRQNGGSLEDITLEDITVKTAAKNGNYVAGLVGYYYGIGNIKNITATKLEINGVNYVGGIAGFVFMSNIDNVNITKSNVKATGNYAGLLAGRISDTANAQSYKASNISIIGTPTYTNGAITGSDTSVKGASEVGAIAGRSYVADCYQAGKQDTTANNIVDGVYVSGIANNIGGAYGYHYTNAYRIIVRNSLIEGSSANARTNLGGIIGNDAYGGGYLTSKNNRIVTRNYSNVGGIYGTKSNSTVNYNYCENVTIEAQSTLSTRGTNVGGAIGYSSYSSSAYCGVINAKVLAPTMDNVGGIVGKIGVSISTNYTLTKSYALGEYDLTKAGTGEAAVAKPEYQVVGYTNVGGIVGKLDGSTLTYSYSNMNVVAKGARGAAGGITGYYNNSYIKVQNSTIKTYSNAKLHYNYFAGSVTAENGFAGGAFGASGLYNDYQEAGGRVKGVSGSAAEAAGNLTVRNLIFATNIVGKRVGAFAGDEGTTFVGRTNRVFEGVKLNGVPVAKMTVSGKPMYTYWTNAGAQWAINQDKVIEIFKASDIMEPENFVDKTPLRTSNASNFYASIGWGTRYQTVNNVAQLRRNTYWRISINGRKDPCDLSNVCVGNYLPQIRSTNSETAKYNSDVIIRNQDIIGRLPVPQYNEAGISQSTVEFNTSVMPETLGDNQNETYAILYVSDVDKINIEFSADMIGTRYYKLMTESGTVISEGVVGNRVYTFSYPFNENLVLSYGADDTGTKTDTYAKEKINRNTLVYGDYYYYFDEKGIVYGNQSSSNKVNGQFVNIMNGKALDVNGYIWEMIDGVPTKTDEKVEAITLMNEAMPLFKGIYNNDVLYTYAKCTEILSAGYSIYREAQMFVKNNDLYILDGQLLNQKDGVLIFNKNGADYMTILGQDGIVVDMYNDDVCLPDDKGYKVKNKAIVNVTNNLNANAPYAIIKYSNGGLLGFNYLSGEVIFDKRVKDKVSLGEYAGAYYAKNEISMYANISNSYKHNLSALLTLERPEQIDAILEGSMSGMPTIGTEIESTTVGGGNSSGNTTKPVGKPDIETGTEEDLNQAINNRTFMAVYDVEKSAYTIVFVEDYLVEADYKSENDRVGIDDLASVIKGKSEIAKSTKDNQLERGIWIYIVAVTLLVAGMVTFIPTLRKNLKYKRR